MSSIKVTNLLQASSSTNNMVLTSGGDVQVTNNLQFNSGYGSAATAYGCRAWVNFNGTTASPSTIRGNGNVSSITKNGTGDYTVNFSTSLVDTNYVAQVNVSPSFGVSQPYAANMFASTTAEVAPSVSSFRFFTGPSSGGTFDPKYVLVSVFR
jgi:hypothetical protein